MKPRQKRLIAIVGGVTILTVAALLILNAFRSNLVYFYSPTEIAEGKAPTAGVFRVGGLVEKGSVQKAADGLKVDFTVTDLKHRMDIHYEGKLPDLFREGQGIVAQGRLGADNRFIADQVLAKHDENYMPPEVAKSLQHGPGGPGTLDAQAAPPAEPKLRLPYQ